MNASSEYPQSIASQSVGRRHLWLAAAIGTVIGQFTTSEAGTGNTFTYKLPTGYVDNAQFTIDATGHLAVYFAAPQSEVDTPKGFHARKVLRDAGAGGCTPAYHRPQQ